MSTPTQPTLPSSSQPPYPPAGYAIPPGAPYGPPPPVYLPPLLAPNGRRLADFGDRLLAWLIDAVIVGAATTVLILPIYVVVLIVLVNRQESLVAGDPRTNPVTPLDVFAFMGPLFGLIAVVVALALLLAYLYYVELMFRSGQTFGKRALRIRIDPVDPRLTLTRAMAAKRFLIQHVAATFVPGLTYVDGLWQLWDKPWRQCLHDKFATTLVTKLDA